MNRREALKGVVTVAAGVAASALVIQSKHGFMTVQDYHAHWYKTGEFLTVFYDGVDVTDKCYEADDEAGFVRVRCTDQTTHNSLDARDPKHLTPDHAEVCGRTLYGHVVIQ